MQYRNKFIHKKKREKDVDFWQAVCIL